MHNMKDLIESIKKHEGFRGSVYLCSEGFETVGYGCRTPLSVSELMDLSESRVITGFGEGIDFPLSESEAEYLLRSRLSDIMKDITTRKPMLLKLPLFKQVIVYEMAYQLGVNGVLNFQKMFRALEGNYYALASKEMLNSKWAKQTPNRAKVLSSKMASASDDASFDVVN
ncbi:MAG: hypothetical protein Q7S59_05915 [Sulfurimonas sp.]|nr:hypothetical protein [Sulfurimonas sp.]